MQPRHSANRDGCTPSTISYSPWPLYAPYFFWQLLTIVAMTSIWAPAPHPQNHGSATTTHRHGHSHSDTQPHTRALNDPGKQDTRTERHTGTDTDTHVYNQDDKHTHHEHITETVCTPCVALNMTGDTRLTLHLCVCAKFILIPTFLVPKYRT